MALAKWMVVLRKGDDERYYGVQAPKGCDVDAEFAARKRWEEEFGPVENNEWPETVKVEEMPRA